MLQKMKYISMLLFVSFGSYKYYEYSVSVYPLFEVTSPFGDTPGQILMDGEVIVDYEVISYEVHPPYLIGLRLPRHFGRACDEDEIATILEYKKQYLILNLRTRELEVTEVQSIFEDRLNIYNIPSTLNYFRFDGIWLKEVIRYAGWPKVYGCHHKYKGLDYYKEQKKMHLKDVKAPCKYDYKCRNKIQ